MRWLVGLVVMLVACEAGAPAPGGPEYPPDGCPPAVDARVLDAYKHDAALLDSGAADAGAVDSSDARVDGGPMASSFPRVEVTVTEAAWAELHEDPKAKVEVEVVLTIDGKSFPETELELHGGFARTVPKKSYRFEIEDEHDAELDLFGDGPERQRRFVLHASWIDPTFFRNKLTMDLAREVGLLAPRMAWRELWVNGSYEGLFIVIERIDKPYLTRQGLGVESLNLYKAENHNANWKSKGDPVAGYDIQQGDDPPDTSDLAALLNACTKTPPKLDEFEEQIEPWLDVHEFLAWQMVHTYAFNLDTFTKNYYLYHDLQAAPGTPEARFRIVSWDADATWGISWDGQTVDPVTTAWKGKSPFIGTDGFSPRVMLVDELREAHLERWNQALEGPFSVAAINTRIDQMAVEIREAAARDLAKWQPERSFDCEVEIMRGAAATRHSEMTREIAELEGD